MLWRVAYALGRKLFPSSTPTPLSVHHAEKGVLFLKGYGDPFVITVNQDKELERLRGVIDLALSQRKNRRPK